MIDAMRLVDTSIFIDYLRGQTAAKTWLDSFSTGALAYSAITAAELFAGCRNQREQRVVEKELARYSLIHVSGAISQTALEWYRQYHPGKALAFLIASSGLLPVIMIF